MGQGGPKNHAAAPLRILIVGLGLFVLPVGAVLADFHGSVSIVLDGDTFAICEAPVPPAPVAPEANAVDPVVPPGVKAVAEPPRGCTTIRICGIDAPEKRYEASSLASKIALESFVKDKIILCVQVGDGTVCDGRSKATNQGRAVAQCFIEGSGADLGDLLVKGGYACDWVKFSGGHYSRDGVGKQCPEVNLVCAMTRRSSRACAAPIDHERFNGDQHLRLRRHFHRLCLTHILRAPLEQASASLSGSGLF